jgi:hypothetical protein
MEKHKTRPSLLNRLFSPENAGRGVAACVAFAVVAGLGVMAYEGRLTPSKQPKPANTTSVLPR